MRRNILYPGNGYRERFNLGYVNRCKGRFSLTLPKMQNVSLLFSFIGMETQEVRYTGQDSIHVVLKESAEQLKK